VLDNERLDSFDDIANTHKVINTKVVQLENGQYGV
jgi:hypothetical protein